MTAKRFESIVRLLYNWHEHSHWKITCIVYVHIWKILSHCGTLYKYIHVYIRFQRNPHLTTWTWTAPAGNNHAWFNLLYVTSFKMKYLFSEMFWFLDLYPNPQQYSSSQTCETEFFKFCAKYTITPEVAVRNVISEVSCTLDVNMIVSDVGWWTEFKFSHLFFHNVLSIERLCWLL